MERVLEIWMIFDWRVFFSTLYISKTIAKLVGFYAIFMSKHVQCILWNLEMTSSFLIKILAWTIFDLDFKVVLIQIGYNKDLCMEFDFKSLKELRNHYR